MKQLQHLMHQPDIDIRLFAKYEQEFLKYQRACADIKIVNL